MLRGPGTLACWTLGSVARASVPVGVLLLTSVISLPSAHCLFACCTPGVAAFSLPIVGRRITPHHPNPRRPRGSSSSSSLFTSQTAKMTEVSPEARPTTLKHTKAAGTPAQTAAASRRSLPPRPSALCHAAAAACSTGRATPCTGVSCARCG